MTESTSTKFVPVEQYQALEDMIEDLRDIIAAKDARSDHSLPAEYARRIFMEIDHPVTVWARLSRHDAARAFGKIRRRTRLCFRN